MEKLDKMLLNSIILSYGEYLTKGASRAEFNYLGRLIQFRIYKDTFNENRVMVSSGAVLRDINISTKIISGIFQELKSDIINNLDKYKKARN